MQSVYSTTPADWAQRGWVNTYFCNSSKIVLATVIAHWNIEINVSLNYGKEFLIFETQKNHIPCVIYEMICKSLRHITHVTVDDIIN